MVAIARSGVHFSDPRQFFRSLMTAGVIAIDDAAGSATAASTAAGFFTEMATRGLADNTNWTAATYKTILSVSSGLGVVMNIIGPTGLAGTPLTTFEITVDGVLYTVPVTATTTGQRAMLGPSVPDASMYTTTKLALQGVTSINAGKDTVLLGGTTVSIIPGWQLYSLQGTPGLIFRQSLLIRMQSSESNSTATNQEKQSAVQYMVMA